MATLIPGFIMRTLLSKEKCMFCYTCLKECKKRVTCPLISAKQLGGLVYPIADVVSVVILANRNVQHFYFISTFLLLNSFNKTLANGTGMSCLMKKNQNNKSCETIPVQNLKMFHIPFFLSVLSKLP